MEIKSAVLGTTEQRRQGVAGPAEEEVVELTICSAKAEGRSFVRTESLCLMRTNMPSVPVAHWGFILAATSIDTSPATPTTSLSTNLELQWWCRNRFSLPCLPRLPAMHLAVPASSASSERVFSVAGNVVTKYRNRSGNEALNVLGLLSIRISRNGRELTT